MLAGTDSMAISLFYDAGATTLTTLKGGVKTVKSKKSAGAESTPLGKGPDVH
jgi:hypothetical protein